MADQGLSPEGAKKVRGLVDQLRRATMQTSGRFPIEAQRYIYEVGRRCMEVMHEIDKDQHLHEDKPEPPKRERPRQRRQRKEKVEA